jgi:hypothetical protein
MAKPDSKQLHLFADDPNYYTREYEKYGTVGEYTKHELLRIARSTGPRLMPTRTWSGNASHLDHQTLQKIETKYIDLRLEFEKHIREKQDKSNDVMQGDYWPNSSKDGYLRIDNSKGAITPSAYTQWLRDSIDFYAARLAGMHTLDDHGESYRDLAWDVAKERQKSGQMLDGKNPDIERSAFEERTIGSKALEVGLYGKRLKKENRGFDPRGFRLDAHHIPYTVTVDITAETDKKKREKMERGESPNEARKEARREARREARDIGPAIMLPWDVHKALHQARNSDIFTKARGNRPLHIKETFDDQLENDFVWLKQQMKWMGYNDKLDIEPAKHMLEQPIKKYKQHYPDSLADQKPNRQVSIRDFGDLDRLLNGSQNMR